MFWQALRYAAVAARDCLIGIAAHAEDDKVETGNATYEIRPDPKNDDSKCVFKDDTQLLCIERELVSFGKPVTTRDYTLIPVYDDCGGSACGRSQTTLLIEKGKQTENRPHAEAILCRVSATSSRRKAEANEVAIALDRKDGHAFSALFRNGAITISKKPLDPKEPLSDDDCTYLYEDLLDTCIGIARAMPQCRRRTCRAPTRARSHSCENYYAAFPAGQDVGRLRRGLREQEEAGPRRFDQEICRNALRSSRASKSKKPGNARLFQSNRARALNASRCPAGDNPAT